MRKLLVLVIAVIGLVGPLAATAHADTVSDEAAFVAKINQLRAGLGLGQLSVDPGLTAIARNWAQQMANAGDISHNPNLKDLVTANWLKLGENVGLGPDVDQLFTAFVNSPHHYENLVDPAFTYIGVGVVQSGTTMFTSHEFMKTRGTPAPSVTAPTAPRTTVTRPPATPRVTVPKPVAATPVTVATTTTTTVPPPPVATTAPAGGDRLRWMYQVLRGLDPAKEHQHS